MRDPNRLYGFYNEVARLHATHMGDWRVCQFWINFLCWIQNKKERDPFFQKKRNYLHI